MGLKGKLYLVSTPIGNLNDITIRAKKVLTQVDLILAEDTRRTNQLLLRLGITNKRVVSYYQDNEAKRIPAIITWLQEGKSIALVSNAGTPLLADPGYKLVREVIGRGLAVEVIPGPSALLTALIISGFPPDHFIFLGFLPKRVGRKKKLLKQLLKIDHKLIPTVVFYEAPTRLLKTLAVIKELFGNVRLAVCRELTKKFEEVIRGRLDEVLVELERRGKIKGEITVVFVLENVS